MNTDSNSITQPIPIQITERDMAKLRKTIDDTQRSGTQESELDSLVAELNRATVVPSRNIGRNVVTMNSTVSLIDAETSEKSKFTLVYPDEADVFQNKISVLSPIGSGMLGFSVGDEFEWQVPAGIRKFTIAKVDHQPEAELKSNRR